MCPPDTATPRSSTDTAARTDTCHSGTHHASTELTSNPIFKFKDGLRFKVLWFVSSCCIIFILTPKPKGSKVFGLDVTS